MDSQRRQFLKYLALLGVGVTAASQIDIPYIHEQYHQLKHQHQWLSLPLTVEEKVAQLFIVSFNRTDLRNEANPFFRHGVGGLIFYRRHFNAFSNIQEAKNYIQAFSQKFTEGHRPFIALDQEGGQVERLPYWFFPSGISPYVFGLKGDVDFCRQVNQETARRLRWLGVNLNFSPVLDLNLNVNNPVIGVRAYGDTPQAVIPYAQAMLESYRKAGVLPVAKHFPGHGAGDKDSHYHLPVFSQWQPEELEPYKRLMKDNLAGVIVAHGCYPEIANRFSENPHIPASLSPGVIQTMLKKEVGFSGLVFSDDMSMGAIHNHFLPVEAAMKALNAGTDMLMYTSVEPDAYLVFDSLVKRVKNGSFPQEELDYRVNKILAVKAALAQAKVPQYSIQDFSPAACHQLSVQWAKQALVVLDAKQPNVLPLKPNTHWGLVAPDRSTMSQYEHDTVFGDTILSQCQKQNIMPVASQFYPVSPLSTFASDKIAHFEPQAWPGIPLEYIVFVAFNSYLHQKQQDIYEVLKKHHPNAKCILVSASLPTDNRVITDAAVHLQLPSYRPAAIEVLIDWLAGKLTV
jgi:beta-N-acetylhexosaminidase